jgi:hypothetical protein
MKIVFRLVYEFITELTCLFFYYYFVYTTRTNVRESASCFALSLRRRVSHRLIAPFGCDQHCINFVVFTKQVCN